MLFEEFQDDCHGSHLGYQNRTILAILNLCVSQIHGGHLGYRIGTILAILNLYVALITPIKF